MRNSGGGPSTYVELMPFDSLYSTLRQYVATERCAPPARDLDVECEYRRCELRLPSIFQLNSVSYILKFLILSPAQSLRVLLRMLRLRSWMRLRPGGVAIQLRVLELIPSADNLATEALAIATVVSVMRGVCARWCLGQG